MRRKILIGLTITVLSALLLGGCNYSNDDLKTEIAELQVVIENQERQIEELLVEVESLDELRAAVSDLEDQIVQLENHLSFLENLEEVIEQITFVQSDGEMYTAVLISRESFVYVIEIYDGSFDYIQTIHVQSAEDQVSPYDLRGVECSDTGDVDLTIRVAELDRYLPVVARDRVFSWSPNISEFSSFGRIGLGLDFIHGDEVWVSLDRRVNDEGFYELIIDDSRGRHQVIRPEVAGVNRAFWVQVDSLQDTGYVDILIAWGAWYAPQNDLYQWDSDEEMFMEVEFDGFETLEWSAYRNGYIYNTRSQAHVIELLRWDEGHLVKVDEWDFFAYTTAEQEDEISRYGMILGETFDFIIYQFSDHIEIVVLKSGEFFDLIHIEDTSFGEHLGNLHLVEHLIFEQDLGFGDGPGVFIRQSWGSPYGVFYNVYLPINGEFIPLTSSELSEWLVNPAVDVDQRLIRSAFGLGGRGIRGATGGGSRLRIYSVTVEGLVPMEQLETWTYFDDAWEHVKEQMGYVGDIGVVWRHSVFVDGDWELVEVIEADETWIGEPGSPWHPNEFWYDYWFGERWQDVNVN